MSLLWWDKVSSSLNTKTVDKIEKFMTENILIKKLHPQKITQLAYQLDFENEALLNIDWLYACQYYFIKLTSVEYLKKLNSNDYVVGNSHYNCCKNCSDRINHKIYKVKNTPILPCCDFCRCIWTKWIPELYYIKDSKIEFAIDYKTEQERVNWVKENRNIFKGKYEKYNYLNKLAEV